MPISIQGTDKSFGGDNVFVIAEIGKNFIQSEDDRSVEEYLENAKALVDAAADSGADAVKFQTHEIEDEFLQNLTVVSPHFKGSDRVKWITRNMNATPLGGFWKPLKEHCDKRGVIFFSTPMSRKAAYKLHDTGVPPHQCEHSCTVHRKYNHPDAKIVPYGLQVWEQGNSECSHWCGGVPFWKVGSGDVGDYATLDFMIATDKPIIISTGMVSLSELDEIIRHIRTNGSPLVVLYCISQYPAPAEYFNLSTIEYLTEKYPDVVVGFSDHSIGHDIPLAAAKLGAKVVEKHFSFSRDLWGADHKVSMTPDEFKEMVSRIQSGAYADADHTPYYGDKEKELEGAGNQFRPYFNKALMAGQDIPEGETITKEMVYAMRPVMYAGGLPANRFYDVVGKRAKRAIRKYEPITEDVLQ